MVELSAVTEAMTALKLAGDTVKTLAGLRPGKAPDPQWLELQARLIDAQAKVLAAQEERSALLQRIRDLEKSIADMETWSREQQRYQLTAVASTFFAYTMKPGMEAGEPPHWLCTACFQNGKKAILGKFGQTSRDTVWKCPTCGAQNAVMWGLAPGSAKG